eukprot:6455199-Amphidinium_carterae.3
MDPDAEVAEVAQTALRLASCVRALGGTMALFDPHPEDVQFFSAKALAPPSSPSKSERDGSKRLRIDEASSHASSEPNTPMHPARRTSVESASENSSESADRLGLLTAAPKEAHGRAEAEAAAARLALRKAARSATTSYCRAVFARFVVLDLRAPRTYRRFLYERISRWIVPLELRQLNRGDIVRFVDVADFQLCHDSSGNPGPVKKTGFTKRRDGMRQVVIVNAPQGSTFVEVQSAQGEAWLKGWVRAFGDKGESLLEKVPPDEVWRPLQDLRK